MNILLASIAASPAVIAVYAYVLYPAVLWAVGRFRTVGASAEIGEWPVVTITVPVYNAELNIRATLERLLELDYPREKLQIVVISDGSTDHTEEIVARFEPRGVELLRMPRRQGKTMAENAALSIARGEIIVNADATVLLAPSALKPLVRVFDDPTIGVASGRDRSVGVEGDEATGAESRYVGYEMWIRDLETRVGSIVGASGCFYAIRRCIHSEPLPRDLSWDFASPLVARMQGYRAVSVPAAVCVVPRTTQLQTELTRKVRTMARGLRTLFYLRTVMNPMRYGEFALMLISHKLLRWVPFLLLPFSVLALGVAAIQNVLATVLFALVVVTGVLGVAAIRVRASSLAKPIAFAGFLVVSCWAGFLAWREAIRGSPMAMWEPTPRPELQS